jgi:hypothetical protein
MLLDLKTGMERSLLPVPIANEPLPRGPSPKITADGSQVVYNLRAAPGTKEVSRSFAVAAKSGVPRELCAGCVVRNNTNLPDAMLVSTRDGMGIYRMGTSKIDYISESVGNALKLSWDDRWLVFYRMEPNARSRVWVVENKGVKARQQDWIQITKGDALDTIPEFSPDGNIVYFLSERDGRRCIWAQRLDATKHPAGEPFPVQHFHSARLSPIYNPTGSNECAVARDKIVLPVTERSSSVWLAEWPEAK